MQGHLIVVLISAMLLAVSVGCSAQVVTAEVSEGGQPHLVINAHRVVPLMFMGWGQGTPAQEAIYQQQVALAAEAGIHIHYTAVISPWPHGGEQPDYSGVDKAIQLTLDSDPHARIVVRYGVRPPEWWLAEHPAARHLAADGSQQMVWVGDEDWRREACKWQAAFIRHIEDQWGNVVIAYHPWAQNSGEWFYHGGWSKQPCFGIGVERSFRAWLKQRYRSTKRLSRAWSRQISDWGQVTIPTEAERRESRFGQFLHPVEQRWIADFFEFVNFTMADAIRTICASAKQACGARKQVGVFYGYLYELAGWPSGAGVTGHSGWRWLLDDPNIDQFFGPISYSDRGFGGAGYFMAPVDSVTAHGKLWLNEDDTRTHLTPPDYPVAGAANLQQTLWLHQRNFIHIFPRRMGCWYMDLGATGWQADPDIWRNIAQLKRVWEDHLGAEPSFHPEIAAIGDERSPLWMHLNSQVPAALLRDLRYPLYRVGAPVGWYLLDDLLAGRVPPAKLYIMQNAFVLTAKERQRLLQIFRDSNVTVIWYYAPGYIDPKRGRADVAWMEELTGMSLEPAPDTLPDLVTPIEDSPLCRGLSAAFGSPQKNLSPRFAVTPGPGVEPIAHYQNGQIAVAMKDNGTWRSVFVGCLYTPAELLRNIARRAGVHIYSDRNDIVNADDHFVGISPTSRGRRTVRLPRKLVVRDALSGELLATGRHVVLSLESGQPKLLLLEAE